MRIAVAGALAQRPGRGGHAWVFLQYLLGFKRLGCDVVFIDRLEPEMCVDGEGRRCRAEASLNVNYLREVMAGFGLHESWAVLVDEGRDSIGIERKTLTRFMNGADLLIDVMGYLQADDLLEAAAQRVFLDIDPGFPQMWFDQGLHDPFGHHDAYLTVGANIGRPDCPIPTCGIDWIATRPPVVLEHWPVREPHSCKVTSVATWRGPFAPLEQDGVKYGLRAHQLRSLIALASMTRFQLELALDIDPADGRDIAQLQEHGWRLVDPKTVAGTPRSYEEYIRQSAAELMIPKGMYAQSASGWFSDRSVCYLAAGRPVVAQDTGLARSYPVDKGLLLFSTLAEAADRLCSLQEDYLGHSDAARSIAEDYFDSDRVLTGLLDEVGRC